MDIGYEVNNFDRLDDAMNVARVVFEPSTEELVKYHQKTQWEERAKKGLLVVASVDGKAVGFAICYPKESALHIWNVGVLNEYRGQKIWQKMYELVENYAKEKKYGALTLNTFPSDFPNMYKFTQVNGFVETSRETDILSTKTKVCLKKTL